MELSKEILNIIDGLAERFGLVVDWSKDNIYPQVVDVMERFVHYKLACNWIWIGLGIILIGVGIWLLVPMVTEFIELKAQLKKAEAKYGKDIYKQLINGEVPEFSKKGNFKIHGTCYNADNWITSTNEDTIMSRAVGGGVLIFAGIIMLAVCIPTLLQLYFVPELYILEWINNSIL